MRVMSLPSNAIVPRSGRSSPLTARSSELLPAPFAPTERDDLAALRRERNALQRADAVVVRVHLAHLEQHVAGGLRERRAHALSNGRPR